MVLDVDPKVADANSSFSELVYEPLKSTNLDNRSQMREPLWKSKSPLEKILYTTGEKKNLREEEQFDFTHVTLPPRQLQHSSVPREPFSGNDFSSAVNLRVYERVPDFPRCVTLPKKPISFLPHPEN